MVNQGDGEGVYSGTRPNRSPKICQEIARNAPPQVIFFAKNETKPIFSEKTICQIAIMELYL